MITITILTLLGIEWEMMKLGGKAFLWFLRWAIIVSLFIGVIIPAFIGIYLTMCIVSFTIWTADIIIATIMKTEPKLNRSPFNFGNNWDRLVGAIDKRAKRQEQRQASRSNDIYVVKRSDLTKVKVVEPKQQPLSFDEIILYDLILDD